MTDEKGPVGAKVPADPTIHDSTTAGSKTVALIGNPNVGKSSLFGRLVGRRQRVGNFPGVTVEKTVGETTVGGCRFEVVDLPGLYSLSAQSLDEQVVVELLAGLVPDVPQVDLILAIVDATQLERNLYLVSQLLERGLPMVVALNKVDLATRHGIEIDCEKLQARLGVPVVAIGAHRGTGIKGLKQTLLEARPPEAIPSISEDTFEKAATDLAQCLSKAGLPEPQWLASLLLTDTSGMIRDLVAPLVGSEALESCLESARNRLGKMSESVATFETKARYEWVGRVTEGVLQKAEAPAAKISVSDRLDRILTHPVWGMVIVFFILFLVFQAVFAWANPVVQAVSVAFEWTAEQVKLGFEQSRFADGVVENLLVDGVLGGVGSILAFLPQIVILFFCIGILEECGYMARAAFMMDRTMSRIGLNGKAFIPLLSCFACAVPGIMATRVIHQHHDRMTTILVTPFIPCSARLPVYALLIGAFIPSTSFLGGWVRLQGLTLFLLYLMGIGTAVLVALLLKKTVFPNPSLPFMIELPDYQWPSISTVLHRVGDRCWIFLRAAGTVILLVSVIVWAALYFPRDSKIEVAYRDQLDRLNVQYQGAADVEKPAIRQEIDQVLREKKGVHQENSYLARLGRVVEPVFRPLGWDWRISCCVLASLPAREAVVAAFGVTFVDYRSANESASESEEEQGALLARKLRQATWEGTDRPLFTLPVALSLLVFYALGLQCAATIAVMRQETHSWKWPLIALSFSMTLAYTVALLIYQGASWLA